MLLYVCMGNIRYNAPSPHSTRRKIFAHLKNTVVRLPINDDFTGNPCAVTVNVLQMFLFTLLLSSRTVLRVSINVLLCSLCFLASATAQVLTVHSGQTEYSLNNVMALYEDKTAQLSIQDVASAKYSSQFQRYTGTSDPNFGHTASVFWVRLVLRCAAEQAQQIAFDTALEEHWIIEIPYPQMDNVQLYLPKHISVAASNRASVSDTVYQVFQSGDDFPFSMRAVPYRMPNFALPLRTALLQDSSRSVTLFLRFQSQGSMTFPIMLRSETAMSRHIINEQFVLGMFYGVLVIMVLYNLFVYFSLRDVSYWYYVLYIAVYGTFLLIWNGLAFQYWWSDSPQWHNKSIIVFMGLSGLTVFRFSQKYLDTKRLVPRAHKLMNATMIYFVVGIVLAFVLPYGPAIKIMYGAPIITLPIVIPIAIIGIRKGYRPARYFFLAWVLLLTSISMAALRNINVLPSGPMTIYGLQIGSVIEIFLLSLGLADRINIIKQEKKQAQEEALRHQQALIETLKRSEQELERKVAERTVELRDANEEISRQLEVQAEQAREIELANTELQEKNLMIEHERENSERLLLNVLPKTIATRLMGGEKLIADRFERVTVLFADIAGFTPLSQAVSPEELVGLLDTIFSEFDMIAERHGLEKIKTIGDCYMLVGGLPEPLADHCERVARAALEMQAVITGLNEALSLNVGLRIGMHTGAVVAGVIGKRKFAYDLWGDTVNTASRMESHGETGKIQISEECRRVLQANFVLKERGEIEVKGKGTMRTWFLESMV